MAAKKRSTKRTTKNSKRKTAAVSKKRKAEINASKRRIQEIVLFAAAIFTCALIFAPGKNLWNLMHDFFFGILGPSAYLIPLLLFFIPIMMALGRTDSTLVPKLWEATGIIVLISSVLHIFMVGLLPKGGFFELYKSGTALKSGGLAGGAIGAPLYFLFGKPGAAITVFLLLFVLVLLFAGISLIQFYQYLFLSFARITGKTGKLKMEKQNPNLKIIWKSINR